MSVRRSRLAIALLASCAALPAMYAFAKEEAPANRYKDTRFVANKASYKASFATDADFINAWGIAIRPAGSGGHFWVTAKDVSYEYVGDVQRSSDKALQVLHQDKLKEIRLPVGGKDNFSTGVVFSGSATNFVITQPVAGAEPLKLPAKFLFASDGGIISAWTERKKSDGTFDWPDHAVSVIDGTKDGSQFFGIAINEAYSRLYAADFGDNPAIRVYDGKFQPEAVKFDMPFDTNKNGKVDPGEYAPFNVQTLKTPAGESHVFVTYAMTQPCPEEEVKKNTCKAGELFVGEEDTSKPGLGRVAEFTEEGKLVAVWKDGGKLSAPWGIVYAPKDFGALSGNLLVGNFGDGTIAAYKADTREFVDVLRDEKGQPVKIDKVWGLLYGNGESLGDSNALYYAAGPEDEADGLFGALRPAK